MHIYVQLTECGRVSIPIALRRVLQLRDDHWLRLTAIGDGTMLMEPVTPDALAPLGLPGTAFPADGNRPGDEPAR